MTEPAFSLDGGAADLVVRGAMVVTADSQSVHDVAVRDGKIAGLLDAGFPIAAKRTIDAAGKMLIPGCIDPHTHIWWPFDDQVSCDTFDSASKSALISGTTTVVDFLPTSRGADPLTSTAPRIREAASRFICDYSFHPILASAAPAVLEAVGQFVEMGLASFKMYTTYPDTRVDDGAIWALMQAIHEAGGLAGFHAENDDIIRSATGELLSSGRTAVRYFPQSRPPLSEVISIGTVSRFAQELGCGVYIYHVSSGLPAVREARERGVNVMAETCTHYLTLSRSLYDGPEAWRYVMSPPLPQDSRQQDLWQALARREIQSVASDHCAYSRAQKHHRDDSFEIPGGVPGLSARVPLLLSEGVNAGMITMQDFVYATSTGLAKSLGIYPRKGSIAVGADADLVIVDLGAAWTFDDSEGGSDFSPYAGRGGQGQPVMTIRRGEVVWDGETFSAEPGSGMLVRQRPLATEAPDEFRRQREGDTPGETTVPNRQVPSGVLNS
jgi:dihydropyrimidinase